MPSAARKDCRIKEDFKRPEMAEMRALVREGGGIEGMGSESDGEPDEGRDDRRRKAEVRRGSEPEESLDLDLDLVQWSC